LIHALKYGEGTAVPKGKEVQLPKNDYEGMLGRPK
jgi:hypothetical protein